MLETLGTQEAQEIYMTHQTSPPGYTSCKQLLRRKEFLMIHLSSSGAATLVRQV